MTDNRQLTSLKHHLEDSGLLGLLKDPTLTDIMLNSDGQVWVEPMGGSMRYSHDVAADNALRIIQALADYHNQTINSNHPILECEIPIDGSRFEGLLPPLVAQTSFVIRKRATRLITLADYVAGKSLTNEAVELLTGLIRDHRNILIVGGTGSGKTTLVNALLHEIAVQFPTERLVMLEDTHEIQCQADNHLVMRTHPNAGVTLQKLLRATLRLRPDRIIVGEVRGGEAVELLKAWNTGHPGGLATIHADSARQGLQRLEQCLSEAMPNINCALIANTIHALVFIQRTPKGRQVTEICQVVGWTADAGYETQSLWEIET